MATRSRTRPQTSEQQSKESTPGELRNAYVPTSRVRVAGVVARVCAAGLMLGLIGALVTYSSDSTTFDIAKRVIHTGFNTTVEIKKPPLGFLTGPLLIMILLPITKGKSPGVFIKRGYLARIAIASVLWLIGLVGLVSQISGLGSDYDILAGTYIGFTLISVGLLATLAMWPTGLGQVQVDKQGNRPGT